MAKKPQPHAPADKVAFYEKLIATNPDVERKGAANPYTSRGGRMFSMLMRDGTMILRLPDTERQAFAKRYKSKAPVQYGVVMKDYVEVPYALLKKTAELKPYFDLAFDHQGTLKPKPTTRPKKPPAKTVKKTARTKGT